jgi:uncharacterized protein YukE
MADVYVDPDRLEEFASKLVSSAHDMRGILQLLQASLQRLAETWRDNEYWLFVNNFQKIERHVEEFINEVERVVPELRKDAQYIREYLSR